MNVLHLASWYPHEKYPYNGDFIQRQLIALSEFLPVTVIHLVKDTNLESNGFAISKHTRTNQMEEWLAGYGVIRTGIPFADQFLSFLKYRRLLKQLVDDYIREKGKPDLIHVHVILNAGIVSMEISKELKIPYVVTEHSTIYHRNASENLWNRPFIFKKINRNIIKNATALLPVSENLGKLISQFADIQKLFVVDNVVDTSIFNFNDLHYSDQLIFIHVSGMTEQKNIEGLLKGMKLLSLKKNNWKCKMVGPFSYEQKQLAIHLGISKFIEWIGEVGYAEVATLMKKSHVHILFSKYENQPCVNIEALCCGLPVIATDVGGLSEVVDHTNGILIPSQNEHALAEAMEKMIRQYDQYNRKKISESAISRFGYKTIGNHLVDIYKSIIH